MVLTVTDNGTGMPDQGRDSGLANLRARAGCYYGSLTIDTPSSGGVRLRRLAVLPQP